HLDSVRTVQRGHVDLGPQGRLGEADRHLTVEVVPPALEEWMLLHQDLDTEVAARRAHVAQFALVALLHPHPALDARVDVDREFDVPGHSSPPRPPGPGIGDPTPFAATGRARGGALENPPSLDDLAPTAAIVAGRGHRPFPGPRSITFA